MALNSPLGQPTVYSDSYDPSLLFPISRQQARDKIKLPTPLPFQGVDIWTGYELSWLNAHGKPVVACAEFRIPYDTPCIVESKSFKLYLNSFNQTSFHSLEQVQDILAKDLSEAVQGEVEVILYTEQSRQITFLHDLPGICLDTLDIETSTYRVQPDFLTTSSCMTEETLHSHLLKSNCLATGQPDWGSLFIRYRGRKINHEGLLKYIISFRTHSGFAEHCVEQIYYDLMQRCQPSCLTVYSRYTRRGGLDINPFRSNFESAPQNLRLIRQ